MPTEDLAKLTFEKMRHLDIAGWSGGGDPTQVGVSNATLVKKHLNIAPNDRVFDFGCGIGRTALGLSVVYSNNISVVGSDIIPAVIDFAITEVSPNFNNLEFLLFDAQNDLYENMKLMHEKSDVMQLQEEDLYVRQEAGSFDGFIAFSVFTHLQESQARHYLKMAHELTKEDGGILITAFLIDNVSINEIKKGHGPYQFPSISQEADRDQFFFGYEGDQRNAFVGMPLSWLAQEAKNLGLAIDRVIFGTWRIGNPVQVDGESFQDVVVLRKTKTLPEGFDGESYLAKNPDVAHGGMTAEWHYLRYGMIEKRQY